MPTPDEPRWSAGLCLFTCGILPATTARRTGHIGYTWAFAIHFLAAAIAVPLLLVLAETADRWEFPTLEWASKQLMFLARSIATEFDRSPRLALGASAAFIAVIELVFVMLAFVAMAWGARDESAWVSFGHALRRVWLHTTHLLWIAILLCTLLIGLVALPWPMGRITPPKLPHRPLSTTPPDSLEWSAYNKAMEEYELKKNRYSYTVTYLDRGGHGWIGRHRDEIIWVTGLTAGTWWFWALFRGVGAYRRTPPILRPLLCEACGYNLTGATLAGRCPECGEPVAASLGPDARSGPLWTRRSAVGWRRAWWRCCVDPMVKPYEFGRQLQFRTASVEHRRFLMTCMLLAFLIGCLCAVGWYAAIPRLGDGVGHESLWLTALLVGWFAAGGVPLLASFAAVGVGIGHRQRNLMAGAMQAACYLGGYVLLWLVFSVIGSIIIVGAWEVTPDALRRVARMLSINTASLGLGAWVLLNLVGLLIYLRLVAKVTAGTRYANT
ncbi:MAG: hypothetical protein V2A79_16045 [Planctomycetota bacterium]